MGLNTWDQPKQQTVNIGSKKKTQKGRFKSEICCDVWFGDEVGRWRWQRCSLGARPKRGIMDEVKEDMQTVGRDRLEQLKEEENYKM